MTATLSRLHERSTLQGRVDREAGKIYGVRLLGMNSRNKRRYTRKAMRDAIGLYEGARIVINHPSPDKLASDRPLQDWVGVSQNVRFENDALVGDLLLRKASEYFDAICEAAESPAFNTRFGLSHEADGESRFDAATGVDVVESITRVDAIAIVLDPATSSGLFESVGDDYEFVEIVNGVRRSHPRDSDSGRRGRNRRTAQRSGRCRGRARAGCQTQSIGEPDRSGQSGRVRRREPRKTIQQADHRPPARKIRF